MWSLRSLNFIPFGFQMIELPTFKNHVNVESIQAWFLSGKIYNLTITVTQSFEVIWTWKSNKLTRPLCGKSFSLKELKQNKKKVDCFLEGLFDSKSQILYFILEKGFRCCLMGFTEVTFKSCPECVGDHHFFCKTAFWFSPYIFKKILWKYCGVNFYSKLNIYLLIHFIQSKIRRHQEYILSHLMVRMLEIKC